MTSHTYGDCDIDRIAKIIKDKVGTDKNKFNLVIGTDSQNFDKTKVVIVIALHEVGKGGIFFYEIQNVNRIDNIGQKLLYETSLSLDYAGRLIEALECLKITDHWDYQNYIDLSIHVDAGKNGPSNQLIPQIVGWITSCGYHAVTKPNSYAASTIANKYSK